MKGFVMQFGNKSRRLRLPDISVQRHRAQTMLRRYGSQAVFAALFLLGLIVGAAAAKGFDESTFDRLDLLFVTNISARLDMSVFDIFVSCFVSYIVFICGGFLAAMSVWGFAAIPLLAVIKGFTAGLSSAFVFSLYKLSGIGFYILVILPGTVLFLFTLIRYLNAGFRMSLGYARLSMFGSDREPELRTHLKMFFKKTLFAFLASGACAAVDMLLWILFADKFDF